jgi:hypothetical protein
MSIEQPRFMLSMILRDIERFESDECQFFFSSEFLARLNSLDPSALHVLRCANSRVWGPLLLEAFLKGISEPLKELESQPVPEDHIMMIDHQRRILQFQLARQHASVELWNLKADIARESAVSEKSVPRKGIPFFLRRR